VRAGRRELALAATERLAQLHRATPSGASADCLAEAYLATGQPEPAMQVARQRIAEQPQSLVGWDTLQRAAFVLGRRDDALRAMPKTLELLGRSEPGRSAVIARNYARWWLAEAPDKAVGLLLGAHLIDGDAGETRNALLVAAAALPRARFDAALAALAAPTRSALRSFGDLLDEVYRAPVDAPWVAVLRDHLLAMHGVAKARGVVMVVVGYPFALPGVEMAQRAAARAAGLPFVPTREAFARELANGKPEDLFAPDGHCNDRGYHLLAGLVAAAIAEPLGR
jgi:tetratricopeptide (TPR) repeat protein